MKLSDIINIQLLLEKKFRCYITRSKEEWIVIPISNINTVSTSSPYTICNYMMESDSHIFYVLLSYMQYKNKETHYLKSLLRDNGLTNGMVKLVRNNVEIIDKDKVKLSYEDEDVTLWVKLEIPDIIDRIKTIKETSVETIENNYNFEDRADRVGTAYEDYVKTLSDIFGTCDTSFGKDVITGAAVCIDQRDIFVVKNIVNNLKLKAHIISTKNSGSLYSYDILFTKTQPYNPIWPF